MEKDEAESGSNSLQSTNDQEDKGKSRAIQDAAAKNEPSMMSRLQDSARMAGDALINNRAGSQEMPLGLHRKGTQSGSSASPTGPGQHQYGQGNTARHVQVAAQCETFRRTQQEAPSSTRAFNDFIDTHGNLPDVERAQLNTQPRRSDPVGWLSSSADIAQVSAVDGSAVADLLSQPDDPIVMPTMEEQIETISAEDVAKLRAALFDSPSSDDLPWDHLLNFTPDLASLDDMTGDGQTDIQVRLGTVDQDSAAGNWLRQWRGVLTGYTNEVWGDLGMLVQEAKKEVENDMVISGGERTDAPALSRLKMILAHIRGPS